MWDKVKSLIGAIAPTIAGALTGPAGGSMAKSLCNMLGLKSDSNPKQIEHAIDNATPEFWLKLKEYELEHAKLEQKERELHAADRADARKMHIDNNSNGKRDYTADILSLSITIGFFGLLFLLVFYKIDPSSKTVIDIIIGALCAAFLKVLDFHFGTSKGSSDKNRILENFYKQTKTDIR